MTNITTFNFKSATIRVVEIDGDPWFAAADVCKSLELRPHPSGGYSQHYRKIDKDERRTNTSDVWGLGNVTIISESGLYKLIMRSDKPEARAFQNWVTRDVLPAIRKDGGYIRGEEKVAAATSITNPE